MGTKLGNIHVWNASQEQVAELLPGALVGVWGEGFVSAYREDFQWGDVEREGRTLSRRLPAATVLTAAIFDSDVVSFEVFQGGKRLTEHLLEPYTGRNKMGKPSLFCRLLGLPPEDEERLKVLWKKGNAEEQLKLTGALLGAPLGYDPELMPKGPVRRDAEAVDQWIAERPAPPKVKSATKAELVQELRDVVKPRQIGQNFFCLSEVKDIETEKTEYMTYVWYVTPFDCLYRLDDDGLLQLVVKRERHPDQPEYKYCASGRWCFDQPKTEFRSGGEDRVVELRLKPPDWEVTWDSAGLAVGQNGSAYVTQENVIPWDKMSYARSPDGKTIFAAEWKAGLQLRDAQTGQLLREILSHGKYEKCCADGFGRFWVMNGSALEGYDSDLQPISRHRLQGIVLALRTNVKGELMVYTYCESDNRAFRVYRVA